MIDRPESGDRDERLGSAYRQAAREEPPAHLDRAILAAARQANARPRFFAWPSLLAWRVPVAVAAVLVVSVSVVTLVVEEKGGSLSRYAESDAITREAAAPRAPAGSPPVAPPAQRPEAAPALSAPAAVQERRRDDAPAARAQAAKPVAPEASMAPAEKSDRAATPQPLQDALREPGPAASAGSAESSAAQAGIAADSAAPALRRTVPERSGNEVRGGAYAPRAAPAPAPAASAKAAPAAPAIPAAVLRELEGQPPEKWLERIETYRREGDVVLAEALRAEFRRRFPDQPVSR
jgi:hypothetical protein